MNKKFIVFLIILLATYLLFRPKYSGLGQKCKCIGYKQDRIDESPLNIVDPKTFKTLIGGTEMITTICFGIPYRCEPNAGYEYLDPSLNIK